MVSSYDVSAYHFHTQRSSGEVVTTESYNLNNNGLRGNKKARERQTFAGVCGPVIPAGSTEGGTRTLTTLRPLDFESNASANSATSALGSQRTADHRTL